MHVHRRRSLAATFIIALAISSGPSIRAEESLDLGLDTVRRLERLAPIYEQMAGDLEFQTLRAQLPGHLDDPRVVDRYLRYLPMSPIDLLKLEMGGRRPQFAIPGVVARWHRRWVELHPQVAREQYGDRYVDRLLARYLAEPTLEKATGPASQNASVGPNRNLAATGSPTPEGYQGEVQVAVNPNDPDEIVIASNTDDAMGGSCGGDGVQAVFHSSDGGLTWGYTCPPDASAFGLTFFGGQTCAAAGGYTKGSDPALAWNDGGEVFLEYLMLCFNGSIDLKLVVASSADAGATWQARGVVSDFYPDKNFYAIDDHPQSPYYGRHYSCWKQLGATLGDNRVGWSADGGVTWNVVDTPEPPGNPAIEDYACDVTVRRDGTVDLAVWGYCFSPCYGPKIHHSKSTDGGLTWSTPVEAADLVRTGLLYSAAAQNDRGINYFGELVADDSGGACDGYLYASFTDVTDGIGDHADVYITRSIDGGATWQAPVKINDDGLDRVQFHPALAVDPATGDLVASWQDGRNDPTHRSVETFLARSTDCGVSFEPNVQVSQASPEFNNSTITGSNENTVDNPNANPNQYGEYMGVDTLGGKAYVAWADSRHFYPGNTGDSQKENIGFAIVDLAPPIQPITVTLTSIAAEDGWLRERRETSGTGSGANATGAGASALRVGDDRRDKQYMALVSFDTSQIPPGATIVEAKLRLQRGKLTGTDPFQSLGNLRVDVQSGAFGSSSALQASDFEAPAAALAAATLSQPAANGDWSEGLLDAAGRAAINPSGITQMRLRFDLDDNDNRSNDYVGFYSGDNSNSTRWPQLVVTYLP